MDTAAEKILEGLSPEQLEAVQHDQGPLLIVAGAGTGKTTVITRRIAHLITTKKARPEEILALTFTDKAAQEMETRVDQLVPYGYTDVQISTFHAFGDKILRDYALELGRTSEFRVLTQPEQIIFLRDHLFELPMEHYRPLGDPTKYLSSIVRMISRCKDENITPDEYNQYAFNLTAHVRMENLGQEEEDEANRQTELSAVYAKYQELMAQHGLIDFGDQMALVLKLFKERAAVLKHFQEKFKYILVDEFQDTNFSQFEIVKVLAAAHRNVTVVGDDDQSIYKFRGAAISNILGFQETYPDTRMIVLNRNYRSTQNILDTAYRLIKFNDPDRLEYRNHINKQLKAQLHPEGTLVSFKLYDTIFSEADAVALTIKQKIEKEKRSLSDFAILVRSNKDAEPFLRALNLQELAWRFSGNAGLYSREEIRMLIAFLRCVADPTESRYLYFLATSDIYGMNSADLVSMNALATRTHTSLFSLFARVEEFKDISEKSKRLVVRILVDLEHFMKLSTKQSTGHVLYEFLQRSSYVKLLSAQPSAANEVKLNNISKFFDRVRSIGQVLETDRVPQFVSYLDTLIEAGDDPAVAEAETEADAVQVITIHRAKGMEYPIVFMVSLVTQKFPTRNRTEIFPLPTALYKELVLEGNFHIQEERRLFYVGMTRAKQELYLTAAQDYGGKSVRKISQFVKEAMNMAKKDPEPIRTSALTRIEQEAPVEDPIPREISEPIPANVLLTLSPYQVDDYETCPKKYWYLHQAHIPLMYQHQMVYGAYVHAGIQFLLTEQIKGNTAVTIEQVLEAAQGAWRNEGFISREHEEQRLEAGKESLRNFFKRTMNSAVPAAVEKDFSFMIGAGKHLQIRGRFDRVDDNLEYCKGDPSSKRFVIITDYKTSEVMDQEKADKRAKESTQLAIYALAYKMICDRIPDRMELDYVDTQVIGSMVPDDESLFVTEELVHKVSLEIRKKNFKPTPDYFNCQYCPYNQICPETAFQE